MLCWVREQVKAAGEQGRCTARVSEIGRELQAALQERINRNKDRFVKAIFNSRDVELNEKVEELICGKNGFAVPTFNDALDRIMDEAYAIQE